MRRKRNDVESTWELQFRITAKRAEHRRFWVGVIIDTEKSALLPWVWCRGGQRAEDAMIRILGRGIKSTRLGWNSGTVAIAEIKIPVPENLEESVACDPLIIQVQQAFAFFTAQHVKEIMAMASA